MSQGLIFKASCIELGTPYETRSYLHYQAKIQIWEWGRERFLRRKGLMKSHIQTYVRYSSSTWYYSLCPSLSLSLLFFLSLLSLLCVYLFSFSVFAFLFFFFSFVCTPSIYSEIQRSCSLIFLSTDQIMEQFSSVFPPHLLISCWAVTHFSASFLFYLFRSFLNFPFLACDTPTFQLFRSTFTKPCSSLSGDAISLFTFQLLFLFYLICVYLLLLY